MISQKIVFNRRVAEGAEETNEFLRFISTRLSFSAVDFDF